MKKKISILVIIILLFLFGGIYFWQSNKNVNTMTVEEKVNATMKDMTLEEKIAQMLIVYYTKDTVDTDLQKIITEVKPGGFILMKENITTYDKTQKFVSDLQYYSKIPMIISIDQEGGLVQRMQNLEDIKPTDIPAMYSLGKTENIDLAYQVGRVMAEEMRTLGINVVYAPVLDIYSNENNTVIGNRSFGKTKETVSNMALSLANGLEENGVIATYKHFPGHGDTITDSHFQLPIIRKNYAELSNLEWVPFEKAIVNNAKIIMVGHIALPEITGNDTPASLSEVIITDILKEKLNYQGLVITDALNMGALSNTYSEEEIYTKAIEAGVDLLLMPNGSKKAIEYIKKNIAEERIQESVKKILTFKFTYLKENNQLDKSYLGSEEHQQIIDQIK